MLVRVWNDNIHPFKQEIAGKLYDFAPKSFLEMEEDEADVLLKRYSPIILGGDDQPLATSYKMLRIDSDDLKRNRAQRENKTKSGTYICQACGYVAANRWELNGHTSEMHSEQWEDHDEARAEIASDDIKRKKRKQG